MKHLFELVVLFDYIFLPLISYTHNGDDTP